MIETLLNKHEQSSLVQYLTNNTDINNELEYYKGFDYLLNKYGREHMYEWLDKYDYDSSGFPLYDNPKNDFEKDVNEIHLKVKNPRRFSSEQHVELEKRILNFMSSCIIRTNYTQSYLENNRYQLIMYMNRYNSYRSYYVYKYVLPDTDKS
jgi:hypothetical protein